MGVGGAVVTGSLTKKIGEFFGTFGLKDKEAQLKKLGYCVPKEDTSSLTFKGVTSDIGKGLNDFFGTKGKYKDYTIGLIALAVVAFIFFLPKGK